MPAHMPFVPSSGGARVPIRANLRGSEFFFSRVGLAFTRRGTMERGFWVAARTASRTMPVALGAPRLLARGIPCRHRPGLPWVLLSSSRCSDVRGARSRLILRDPRACIGSANTHVSGGEVRANPKARMNRPSAARPRPATSGAHPLRSFAMSAGDVSSELAAATWSGASCSGSVLGSPAPSHHRGVSAGGARPCMRFGAVR